MREGRQEESADAIAGPSAERKGFALEGGDREFIGENVIPQRLRVGRARAEHSLTEDAHAEPGLIIAFRHRSTREPQEAPLHFLAGKFRKSRMPGGRDEPLRSDDGPRIGAVEKQVVAVSFILVDDENHVVIRHALGQKRHLLLGLLMAGICISRAGVVSVVALGDDSRTKARCRTPDRRDIIEIGRLDAVYEEPMGPFLIEKKLPQSVGAHRVAGRKVKDIAAALRSAQRVVAGADVENNGVFCLGKIGYGEEILRLKISDDKPVAGGQHFFCFGDNVGLLGKDIFREIGFLIDEFASDVVIGSADPRASYSLIADNLVEE